MVLTLTLNRPLLAWGSVRVMPMQYLLTRAGLIRCSRKIPLMALRPRPSCLSSMITVSCSEVSRAVRQFLNRNCVSMVSRSVRLGFTSVMRVNLVSSDRVRSFSVNQEWLAR